MANFEIDVSELQPAALAVLQAALALARNNREVPNHVVPLAEFYRLADLGDEVYVRNFMSFVVEAMTAAAYSPDYDADVLCGGPVFKGMLINKTSFEFAVNTFALDACLFPLPR